MGGGSETVRSAQIVGLSDKHGTLKKKILLENGKNIPSGMGMVIKSRGQSIADMKSLYNKKYLEAMGYAPNDSILVDKLSEGKVLEYTKNNRNINAQYVSSLKIDVLDTLDQAILELQDKPDFKRTEMSFTHTDGKQYLYFTAVQNGAYIDISCYLNREDTVVTYLNDKYPNGYTIINYVNSVVNIDGLLVWDVVVNYIYYEDEEIEGEIVRVQKTGTSTEHIDCIFIYFTVLDAEEEQMYKIAQQHSGPFTIIGTYLVEDDEYVDTPYTVTANVYGTFTVTYIGNGEFSYSMNAPIPTNLYYPTSYAWFNGVSVYQEITISSVENAIFDNVRKLIWDYGTDINNLDNIKKTYVLGDILNSFIVKVQADAYPIIALKKWRSFVNNSKMDIVLKKIGIEGKDFRDSLSNPYIVDAHLFFGVPFNSSNPALVQYIFEFFTTMSNIRENYQKNDQISGMNSIGIVFDPKDTTSSANIYSNGMEIQQNYFVDYEVTIEPAIRPVGSYWYQEVTETIKENQKVESPGGTGTTIIPVEYTVTHKEYCHQETESYYIRIRPSVINYYYKLNGIRFTNFKGLWGKKGGSGNEIELRLPLIKQITNKMGFNLLCDLIEQSMSIAYYTEQEVKTKWYQSGFFKFLTAAVLMYFGQYWAIGLMIATEVVIGVFGTKLGGIFAIIMTVVALITQNYGTAFQMTAKNVLMTASQVLSMVSQANNLMFGIKIEEKQKNYESILGAQNNEKDKLQEEYDELHENDGMSVNLFNNVKTLDDIDNYYNMATGNFDSYYLMFDYATNYDKFFVSK